MRTTFLIFLSLFFNDGFAFSFDPSLATAMNDAEAALHEELSIPEPVLCKKAFRSSINVKSKGYKSCQIYRATLTNYQSSIMNARKRIRVLDGWMPTERIFVDRSENFVFLDKPSNIIPKINQELINKLDLLYVSIYQYPLKP